MKRKSALAAFVLFVTSIVLSACFFAACAPKEPNGENKLASISVTTQPNKVAYFVGEKFDPTGMVVTAVYEDGTTEAVTEYTYTPTAALKLTDKTVTVVYDNLSTTVQITVSAAPEAESIEITTPPDKTTYFKGDTFDRTGMVVSAVYADGTKKVVTDYGVSHTVFETAGSVRLSVVYDGWTAFLNITVVEPRLSELEITTPPDCTLYGVGETFDPTGLVVSAVYENGVKVKLDSSQYTLAGAESALAQSDTAVEVSFTDGEITKTAAIQIRVLQLTLTSIKADAENAETEYSIGDKFNAKGLTVYGVYNNEPELTRALKGWTVVNADKALALTDTSVTVGYDGFTTDVQISVLPKYKFEAEALGFIAVDGGTTKLKRGMEYGSNGNGANSGTVKWSDVSGTGLLSGYDTVAALTLDVTVATDTEVTLIMCMSSHAATIGTETLMSSILNSVEIGNKSYAIEDGAALVRREGYLRYVDYQEVVTARRLELKAGNNTIKFTFSSLVNFDYVALRSPVEVKLTAEKDSGHTFSEWLVTKVPTATESGEMYRYCPTCAAREEVVLPANLDNAEVYTLVDSKAASYAVAASRTYTYDGKTFTIKTGNALGATSELVYDFEDARFDASYGEALGLFNSGMDTTAGRDIHGTGAQKFNDGGGRWVFTVYANTPSTVKMYVRIARNATRHMNIAFNMRLNVNGVYVPLDTNNPIGLNAAGSTSYFDWIYVECAMFDVVAGKNEITVDALAAPFSNVDDIKLVSVSKLERTEDKLVEKVEITTPPTKTEYLNTERFNTEGMVVTATLKDGSTKTVTDYYIAHTGLLDAETTAIEIMYQGKTVSQSVTVTEVSAAFIGLEMTHAPAKTEYIEGDAFDPAGMVVSAKYDDGTSAEIAYADLTSDMPALLTPDVKVITFSYNGFDVTLDVNVLYKNIFEAEAFGFTGTDVWRTKEYNADDQTPISGTGYLAHWSEGGVGKLLTFSVYNASNSDVTADMVFCFGQAANVGDKFSAITVNGKAVAFENVGIKVTGYIAWTETPVAATLTLAPGNNDIAMTIKGKANFDYVALISSAKLVLTAEKDSGHSFIDWTVYKTPTATEAGGMYRYCPVCCAFERVVLPADLDDTTVYTLVSQTEATEYVRGTATYTYDGKTFTVTTAEATGAVKENVFEYEHAVHEHIADSPIYNKQTNGGAVSVAVNNSGMHSTFTVYAENAATVRLVMRGGAVTNRPLKYAEILKLTLNGTLIGMDYDCVLPANTTGTSYFNWGDTVVAEFELRQGVNTIVITNNGGHLTNVDCIKLLSASDITWDYNTLTVSAQPTKTEYAEGDTFDITGLVASVSYTVTDSVLGLTNEVVTSKPLDTEEIGYSHAPLQLGTMYMVITYGSFEAEVPIIVKASTVDGITVKQLPDITHYLPAQQFDSTGIKVFGVTGDTEFELFAEQYELTVGEWVAGDVTVTVTYKDDETKTTSFTVNVASNTAVFEAEGAEFANILSAFSVASENGNQSGFARVANWHNVNNKLVFNVYSSEAVIADIYVTLQATGTATVTGAYAFSKLEVNGTAYTISADGGVKAGNWATWHRVLAAANVAFEKGENVISIWATANNTNFDCIDIVSATAMRWSDEENGKAWGEWIVDTLPTADKAGALYRISKHGDFEKVVLPANLANTELYTVKSTVEATEAVAGYTVYEYSTETATYTFRADITDATGEAKDHKFGAKTTDGDGTIKGFSGASNPPVNDAPKDDDSVEKQGLAVTKLGTLSYDVTVSADTTVELILDLAPTQKTNVYISGTLFIYIDGELYLYSNSVYSNSNTPDYFTYADYSITSFDLTEGTHTVTLAFGACKLGVLRSVNLKSVADITLTQAQA